MFSSGFFEEIRHPKPMLSEDPFGSFYSNQEEDKEIGQENKKRKRDVGMLGSQPFVEETSVAETVFYH